MTKTPKQCIFYSIQRCFITPLTKEQLEQIKTTGFFEQYKKNIKPYNDTNLSFFAKVYFRFLRDFPQESSVDFNISVVRKTISAIIRTDDWGLYNQMNYLCDELRRLGATPDEVYELLRKIRETICDHRKNQPELIKENCVAFVKSFFSPEKTLTHALKAIENVNHLSSSSEFADSYYCTLRALSDSLSGMGVQSEVVPFNELLMTLLSNKEDISNAINEHNLRYLQKRYRDSFPLYVNERRLSKEHPKSSQSPLKEKEAIKKIRERGDRTVYDISRTYRLPIEDTTTLAGYRSAFRFAKTMKFNSNAKKSIEMTPPPHVSPNTVAYHLKYRLAIEKLRKMEAKAPYKNSSCAEWFARRHYAILRDDIFDVFEKILNNPENAPETNDTHDLLFRYCELPKNILTPSVLRHLLSLPLAELQKDWGFLDTFNNLPKNDQESARRLIYKAFRKGLSPKEIETQCNALWEQTLVTEYNLSHEQLKMITENYLPVVRRYRQRGVSPAEFLRIFGKKGIQTVLNPKKDCIFKPTEYRLPSMEKTALAALVNERLGSLKDSENLSSRKKLYHKLDMICPVEDIRNGKFSEEDIPRIKRALNLSPNKTLNLAGNFSAKIEEKCSPEFLIAGDASVCCMGLGSEKAVKYALQSGFGIFNVYFKDRIIANSLLWVNNEDTLVIDNIEVHPNYAHHDAYIREMYQQMIQDMRKIYPNIVQGETYNDLELYDENSTYGKLSKWSPTKITGQFYSDAEDGCYVLHGNEEIIMKPNIRVTQIEDDDPWGDMDLDFHPTTLTPFN